MIARGAVFLNALGADAQRLHPELLSQMRRPSQHDRADGVFTVVGSRFRWLTALGRPLVGPEMLLTRFGRDIPFTLTGDPMMSPAGRAALRTTREIQFPGSTQSITDRLTETSSRGLLRNLLGAGERVELLLDCTVTEQGSLRLCTQEVAVLLGRRRVVLRGPFAVDITVEDAWDESRQRRTIDMRARSPLLGTVLEYRGWYVYPDDRANPESRESGGP